MSEHSTDHLDSAGNEPPIRELEDANSLIGRVFDSRYRILDLIGRGGMSVVYRAQQLSSQDIVALKVMTQSFGRDQRNLQRFNQEALASSRLRHPNTIKVFDYGQSRDGYLFIAMEYLQGRTLAEEIVARHRIDPRRLCAIAVQVCRSLGHAHSPHRIVHRDLKPDNVFLLDRPHPEIPGVDMVKVLDFGIAKFISEGVRSPSLTQTGFICGTPLYISPEQGLDEEITNRTDLYSLGVMLFEALSGQPPFRADTAIGVVLKHIHDPPPPLRPLMGDVQLPAVLERLVFALLEKDPKKRPASANEVRSDLEALLRDDKFGNPEMARLADHREDEGGEEEGPTRILVVGDNHPGGVGVARMPSNERPTMYLSASDVEAARSERSAEEAVSAKAPPPPPPRSAISPRGVPDPAPLPEGGRTMPQPIGLLPLGDSAGEGLGIRDPRSQRRGGANGHAASLGRHGSAAPLPAQARAQSTQIVSAHDIDEVEAHLAAAGASASPRTDTVVDERAVSPNRRRAQRDAAAGAKRGNKRALLWIGVLAAVASMVGAYFVMRSRQARVPAEDVAAQVQAAEDAARIGSQEAAAAAAKATEDALAAAEKAAQAAARGAAVAPPAVVDLSALAGSRAQPAAQPAAEPAVADPAAPAAAGAPSEAPPMAEAPAGSGTAAAAPAMDPPPPAAELAAAAAEAPEAAAAAVPHKVGIISEPEGAIIWLGDVELGKAPLDWEWPASDTVELRAEKAGYFSLERTLAKVDYAIGDEIEFVLSEQKAAGVKRTAPRVRSAKKTKPAAAPNKAVSAPAKAAAPKAASTAAKPAAPAAKKSPPRRNSKTKSKIDWKEW